jgi:hypothetical protein
MSAVQISMSRNLTWREIGRISGHWKVILRIMKE